MRRCWDLPREEEEEEELLEDGALEFEEGEFTVFYGCFILSGCFSWVAFSSRWILSCFLEFLQQLFIQDLVLPIHRCLHEDKTELAFQLIYKK